MFMGCVDAFSPKIKIKIDKIENSVPLKGFPEIQANIATESNGINNNVPKSLFEGCHFATKAIINA